MPYRMTIDAGIKLGAGSQIVTEEYTIAQCPDGCCLCIDFESPDFMRQVRDMEHIKDPLIRALIKADQYRYDNHIDYHHLKAKILKFPKS